MISLTFLFGFAICSVFLVLMRYVRSNDNENFNETTLANQATLPFLAYSALPATTAGGSAVAAAASAAVHTELVKLGLVNATQAVAFAAAGATASEAVASANPAYLAPLVGVSQIFVVNSPAAGALILAAMALESRGLAFAALAGSSAGCVTGALLGAPGVADGLWGFNSTLSAVAIAVFFVPTWSAAVVALAGRHRGHRCLLRFRIVFSCNHITALKDSMSQLGHCIFVKIFTEIDDFSCVFILLLAQCQPFPTQMTGSVASALVFAGMGPAFSRAFGTPCLTLPFCCVASVCHLLLLGPRGGGSGAAVAASLVRGFYPAKAPVGPEANLAAHLRELEANDQELDRRASGRRTRNAVLCAQCAERAGHATAMSAVSCACGAQSARSLRRLTPELSGGNHDRGSLDVAAALSEHLVGYDGGKQSWKRAGALLDGDHTVDFGRSQTPDGWDTGTELPLLRRSGCLGTFSSSSPATSSSMNRRTPWTPSSPLAFQVDTTEADSSSEAEAEEATAAVNTAAGYDQLKSSLPVQPNSQLWAAKTPS